MFRFLVIACVAGAVLTGAGRAFSADEKSAAEKKELKKFEGTWRASRVETGGQLQPGEGRGDGMVIEEDQVQTLWGGNNKGGKMVYHKLDPKADPKTIDAEWTSGQLVGQKLLGIYRLDGDKLEICWGEPDSKKRPKKFSTKPGIGNGATFVTYKREKDTEDAPAKTKRDKGGKAATAEEEMKKFEGTWRANRVETAGRLQPGEGRGDGMVIEGESVQTLWGGNNKGGTVKILKIDPKAEPKTIDWEWTNGNFVGQKQLGIYRLDGDKLEICWGEMNGKKRPTKFETKPGIGNGHQMVTYKREKE